MGDVMNRMLLAGRRGEIYLVNIKVVYDGVKASVQVIEESHYL